MQYLLDLINPPAPVEPTFIEQAQEYIEQSPEIVAAATSCVAVITFGYCLFRKMNSTQQPTASEVAISAALGNNFKPAIWTADDAIRDLSSDILPEEYKQALMALKVETSEQIGSMIVDTSDRTKKDLVELLKQNTTEAQFIKGLIKESTVSPEETMSKAIATMLKQNASVHKPGR